MNRKREWLPKREWARREVAKIDSALAEVHAERIPSANWRRIRAKAAASSMLHARRDRLARIAGSDFIPDDECGPF